MFIPKSIQKAFPPSKSRPEGLVFPGFYPGGGVSIFPMKIKFRISSPDGEYHGPFLNCNFYRFWLQVSNIPKLLRIGPAVWLIEIPIMGQHKNPQNTSTNQCIIDP